ncbi:MAG TPA: carboxypeptidase regulatory-like domain-containing protein, partial [Pyrinomonadaceae bacterium]|nr:carboxypeptidase regulatory-like domain-containing protein [Pyrinomonadaceae bacterium]
MSLHLIAVRKLAALFCPVMLIFLASLIALSQTLDTGTIRGQVLDQNSAAIVDAEVTITNQLTGFARKTRTDENGYYNLAGLPLTGKYRLTIYRAGFANQERSNIELRAGEAASLDVTLVPEGGRSEVTVLGTTEGVQGDSSQLATRLDLEKIDNTPVFGRKITNLVQLDSAVRPARGTGDLFLNNFLFIVNGGGRRQTTFTLDGSTDDDVWGRQTLFTNIPLSALQEFTVLTNSVSAEYGRTTGSVVNINTKSGTNDYHFDFLGLVRPSTFQARAPLALQRTADRLKQLSGVFSGPITKDRTYFLVGAEYNNQLRDSTITSPLAPGVFTGRYEQGLLFARIDHQLNGRHNLSARFNLDRFTDTNPADAVGGNNLPTAARNFHRRT